MKKQFKPPEHLFHYTCAENLKFILEDGILLPSCSNLRPFDKATYEMRVNPRSDRLYPWDKNSDYKPVVWLTALKEAEAENNGNAHSGDDKTEYRIRFIWSPRFKSWHDFADENEVEPTWRKRIEHGCRHKFWWVHEGSLSITDPDVTIWHRSGNSWEDITSTPSKYL